MKKRKNFGISIGASSILVVIVILALVCFAGLSLASANADYSLCNKLSDRTHNYYDAVSKTYETIAKESASDAIKGVTASERSVNTNYAINDNQELHVEISLHPASGQRYEIKKFKIETINEEELDDSLSLLIK